MLLTGSVCVVTGAGRGIGRHTAETFARHGASLALCSRNRAELEVVRATIEEDLGGDVLVDSVDVSDSEEVERFAGEVLGRFGRVSVLVNNAAIQGPVGPLTDVDLAAWGHAVSVNLLGVVNAIRAFVPAMRSGGGGRIINLSGGGLGGSGVAGRLSAYTASKAAVLNLTETLSKELAPHRIWINALAPGAINTSFVDGIVEAGPERAGADLYASTLRQRSGGDPIENVGEAMLFLASERSSCLTGKLISAKWDPLAELGDRAADLNERPVYTLRRIDDVLFVEAQHQ